MTTSRSAPGSPHPTSSPSSSCAALPGDPELLRSVAAKLAGAGRDAILCAPDEAGASVVIMRAAGSTLDCSALWKRLAVRLGGRGGGRPERAEGKLATAIADWPA